MTRTLVKPLKSRKNSRKSAVTTVSFGAVSIKVDVPSLAQVGKNIKSGQQALKRAGKRLAGKGVKLGHPDNIPLFYADPTDPDLIIRVIGKTVVRGKMVRNGVFQPVKCQPVK